MTTAPLASWTRRSADEVRHAGAEALGLHETHDAQLVRAVNAPAATRRPQEPQLSLWAGHRNGHAPAARAIPGAQDGRNLPAAAFCKQCGKPSALGRRRACVDHAKAKAR